RGPISDLLVGNLFAGFPGSESFPGDAQEGFGLFGTDLGDAFDELIGESGSGAFLDLRDGSLSGGGVLCGVLFAPAGEAPVPDLMFAGEGGFFGGLGGHGLVLLCSFSDGGRMDTNCSLMYHSVPCLSRGLTEIFRYIFVS